MKKIDYHSCYDEMLAKIFLTPKSEQENTYLELKHDEIVTINSSLTAHEVLIYSLLLHKCIELGSENASISYKELQELRNKRCGKKQIFDPDTLRVYNKTFNNLMNKYIKYDLDNVNGTKRKRVTYRTAEQPLVIINNVECLSNGNKKIDYSLGMFGKTLLESRRYSTLLPSKYFQINFREIMSYELALYICKIIFIERQHKKKSYITITLKSIMKNTNKYVIDNKQLIKYENCYDYVGSNVRRLSNLIIQNVNEVLEQLKAEYTIKNYILQDLNVEKEYSNIQWKLLLDK